MLDLEAKCDLEAMAPRDRLAFLSEIVSRDLIEERLLEVGDRPARGHLQGKALGGLDLIEVSGANMRAQRTRAHVARSQSAVYLLSIQLAGANSFRWCEQDVTTSPGDIFIVDSRHAYDIDGERPFHQLIVRLPKTWVDARLARPDLIPGALLRRDNPMSRLLASYVRSGFESTTELSADAAAMFAAHSVELLAVALGERPCGDVPPAQVLREALFIRAGRLIALRFAEPDLTPDRIARSLGISARLLQKVFAERGAAVMERVWESRVNQAARLLALPDASHRSITEIAFACGFKDSAHFTRAFATRMDVTPSQWRQQARVERERLSGG
jgi:AraC family transcriptional activator of tynA and feaB